MLKPVEGNNELKITVGETEFAEMIVIGEKDKEDRTITIEANDITTDVVAKN